MQLKELESKGDNKFERIMIDMAMTSFATHEHHY